MTVEDEVIRDGGHTRVRIGRERWISRVSRTGIVFAQPTAPRIPVAPRPVAAGGGGGARGESDAERGYHAAENPLAVATAEGSAAPSGWGAGGGSAELSPVPRQASALAVDSEPG